LFSDKCKCLVSSIYRIHFLIPNLDRVILDLTFNSSYICLGDIRK
jgi:hypothetical protein